MKTIRIGTMVAATENMIQFMEEIAPYGFESFALTYNKRALEADLAEEAKKTLELLGPLDIKVSCISAYGNVLQDEEARKAFEILIDNAQNFGTDLVTGFPGRIEGEPIENSIPKYKEVFSELSKRAADKGVRIAFENCPDGPDNIAINPTYWEMMFDALPADNIGLEWEPCHQIGQFIDPVAQLRKWAPKVFHLHGKDASMEWDVLREKGIKSNVRYFNHRVPGFGDTNWKQIITILRENNFCGSIDIEPWHDVVLAKAGLEMSGQVYGMNYLKYCRGGKYYPYPNVY